ncbi:MAG TPA: response regulator transcription factor [Gaiellaceae bacterium]
MITVGVVDDHMIVLDGIRAMAERTDDIEYWGGASSGRDLLEMMAGGLPNVLLLDLRLASENGFEICRHVHELYPSVRIVVFTAHGNAALLRESVRAGAVGYILKDASTRRIPDVLRHVHQNGSYFDPRLAGEVILAIGPSGPTADPELSDRERAVLAMIANGRTNVEIARELHFSHHTIKIVVSDLLAKFGVARRTELARIAAEREVRF